MNLVTLVDFVGYAASAFVVASFLLSNILWIRRVNLIGCVLFVVYAVTKGWLWPVIIPNLFLSFVQVYYLWKLREKSQ